MIYPTLPHPPEPEQGEPREYYGARLVVWLLQDGNRPIMLTDEQAARAQWSCTAALAQRIVLGTGDTAESTPAIVFDHLETVRSELTRMIARRAKLDGQGAPDVVVPPPVDDRTEGGRRVPIVPIVPTLAPIGGVRRPAADGIQF